MKRVTETIIILPSDELSRMHLAGLTGRKGTITERIFGGDGSLIGYMILLEKSFQGEHLWFLPEDAVAYEEDNQ